MEIRPGARSNALSRAELRDLDRRCVEEFGIPSLVLMEHAGAGAAREIGDWLARRGVTQSTAIAVLAGAGNNGGDGFVVARFLAAAGWAVRVFLLALPERLTGDAATEFGIARACGVNLECAPRVEVLERELSAFGVCIDALLGTGHVGAVREPAASWIRCLGTARARGALVVAIDVPSGIDVDTGARDGPCVLADLTLTLAAPKLAFGQEEVRDLLGDCIVLAIGAPREAGSG